MCQTLDMMWTRVLFDDNSCVDSWCDEHTCVCGSQFLIELVNVVLLIQILGETSYGCVCIGVCILKRKGPEGSVRSRRRWNIVMYIIDVWMYTVCTLCVYQVCYLCVVWWTSCVWYGGHQKSILHSDNINSSWFVIRIWS